MSEVFEFEYNALQEMLIVNHQEGFSYNMCDEDDVFSVATKLNEQQATINKLKEENDRIKTKGLDVLAFYESKLKDAVGTEDFQCVRDEIWIVRQVLYEIGVIDDK